jgi:hypothetical protein
MLLQKDVVRSSSVGTKLPLWAFFLKGDFGRFLEKILVWCQSVLFSKKMWELSHFQSIAVWLNRYMLGKTDAVVVWHVGGSSARWLVRYVEAWLPQQHVSRRDLARNPYTMLVSLTVGKVDAGVAVLLTDDKRLVRTPTSHHRNS